MKTVRFTQAYKFSNDGGLSILSVAPDDVKDVSDKIADRLVMRNVAKIVEPEAEAPADADEVRARENMKAAKDADGEGSDDSKESEGSDDDKATDAAPTGEDDGNTDADPSAADDGSELDDSECKEGDEGWAEEGDGKNASPLDKAVKPDENK